MTSIDALRERGAQLGVETSYWDVAGHHHEASAATLQAIVDVLEVDVKAIAGDGAPVGVGLPSRGGGAATGEAELVGGEGTALGRLARHDVRALLARAAVFVSPARYEPFGLGILEAARSGCALVLGDVPSLREVWGEAAVFAAPDDDEAVAAALRLVAGDAELRLELAERARRRAARYTVEAMAAGYERVYEQVLSAVVA
jgi:glycosyltransferase involved in cell wall biosynthesis